MNESNMKYFNLSSHTQKTTNMINDRFINYFRENFFSEDWDGLQDFLRALEKPLPKTIRIKPWKVDAVRKRLEWDGYILTGTGIATVFAIDRSVDFDPLERRIGYSLDHLLGNFYIQELAAAHPVHILANENIDESPYLILDMASSPGGKTTELAEYFPKSFIIANEPTRERIPQLLQNLDRMGSLNIGVTLYPGQYFAREAEIFDRILLDAPCSWEGTAFRWGNVLENWHIKNVKKIAHLQEKLLESALIALKIWGEMVYSTCTLNLIENEWVLLVMQEKYPDRFEIIFQKKWWPHRDATGGFFVAKIRKTGSIQAKSSSIDAKSNEEIQKMKDLQWLPIKSRDGRDLTYFRFRDKILSCMCHPELENMRKKYFFMRLGEEVGKIDNGYMLTSCAGRDLPMDDHIHTIPDEMMLDRYLRWDSTLEYHEEGKILIEYRWLIIWSDRVKNGCIENIFPKDWRRK